MSVIVKNQAIKLYDESETLFNDKTSRCEWHQDYFPLVTCDDVSDIIMNIPEVLTDVGVDSDFSFSVVGTIDSAVGAVIIDASSTFQSSGVTAGMYFMSYTSGVNGVTAGGIEILSVDSEIQITLVSNAVGIAPEYYEISEWDYVGDIRTVNGYAEIDNDPVSTTNNSALRQAITDGVFYKVEFTVTFVDPDAPATLLVIDLGSNTILSLFVDEVEAKKYTAFGVADGTLFDMFVSGNPTISIDDVVLTQMAETTFEIRDCDTDNVEYSSVVGDFIFSNTLDQLKMSIDWSNISSCEGCYYINVVQDSDIENISNGGFASSTDWSEGTGWSIGLGSANMFSVGAGAGSLIQTSLNEDLKINTAYDVSFEVTGGFTGSFDVKLYSSSVEILDLGAFTSDGIKTINTGVLTSAIDEIRFVSGSASAQVYSIDDVSIIEVPHDYRTDCMSLSDSYDCTVKLSGTNNDNAFGIDFEALVYSPFIRVQGELMTPKYDGDKENEEDSLGISKTLYFKSETKRDLFLYQLPIFHHEFIRLLIGYDTLLIDDVEYVSTAASYEPEVERILGKISDRSNSTTELRLEDDLNENKFC